MQPPAILISLADALLGSLDPYQSVIGSEFCDGRTTATTRDVEFCWQSHGDPSAEFIKIDRVARLELQLDFSDQPAAFASNDDPLVERDLDLRCGDFQQPCAAFDTRFELRIERLIADDGPQPDRERFVKLVQVGRQTAGPDFNFSVMTGALRPARRTRRTMPCFFKSPVGVSK
jgi:hypothetical protein